MRGGVMMGRAETALPASARTSSLALEAVDLQAQIDAVHRGEISEVVLGPGLIRSSSSPFWAYPPDGYAPRVIPIRGAGDGKTVIQATEHFTYTGLFGYRPGPISQLHMSHVTLDGNARGLNGELGGELDYREPGNDAILSLPPPYCDAYKYDATWLDRGLWHVFEDVEFFRPTGFTCQGTHALHLIRPRFYKCGQPDRGRYFPQSPDGGACWDILGGGGYSRAKVEDGLYLDSAGNYADFVTDDPAKPYYIDMARTRSINHQIGGIYSFGDGSLISGCDLRNRFVGSGVGYDASTAQAFRGRNRVDGRYFENLGVSFRPWGDTYGDPAGDEYAPGRVHFTYDDADPNYHWLEYEWPGPPVVVPVPLGSSLEIPLLPQARTFTVSGGSSLRGFVGDVEVLRGSGMLHVPANQAARVMWGSGSRPSRIVVQNG